MSEFTKVFHRKENIMTTTKICFKKLDPKAHIPQYGTEFSAGADLYACMEKPLTIAAGATEFVHTGIAVEIPAGLAGLVYARSGLSCKKGLAPANKVGVIDSDYRGEIMVALHNHSAEAITIDANERVAQMVITPYVYAEYEEVQELADTVRGTGGFGSTGMK